MLNRQLLSVTFSKSPVVLGVLLVLGTATRVSAQDIQLGLDFATVVPRGEFKQNVTNNGYGLGGHFAVRVAGPLYVGADLGFVNYGREKRTEQLSTTIPDIRVDVITENNIFWTHFLVRAQPQTGSLRPYLDGLVGFRYLFTSTNVRSRFSDEPIASTTHLSDFPFSYGVGGGVQARLARVGRGREILLDGKLRYLRGSEADYLRKGSIRREGGSVFFDVLRSRTDVVSAQVGITFRL
jgi:hypothetical protein